MLQLEREPGDVALEVTAPIPPRPRRQVTVLFGTTAFVASALLFVVEPLVARTLLPVLGGSASVWNSAMLTFQVLLLVGYLLAHLGTTRMSRRRFPVVAVLAAATAGLSLPVGLRDGWHPPPGSPVLWTLFAVAAAVALPFLVLACVSPMLQRWYADVAPGTDPYVLYAASNAGSFIGLLAYPLVLERTVGIAAQRDAWTAGYVGAVVLLALCARLARRSEPAPGADEAIAERIGRPARADLWRWVAMAAGPSLLLLGATRHLSTDVAAIPLLWVVPLSLYLLTFVIAFSGHGEVAVRVATRLSPPLAAVAIVSLAASLPSGPGIALHLVTFAVLALAVHGRLAAERPAPVWLTSFYLATSAGGAIGGLIGGLVAPVLFPGIYEYPLGLLACMAWIVPRTALAGRARTIAAVALVAMLAAAAAVRVMSADADGPPRGVQLILGLAALAALACSTSARRYALALAAAAVVVVALPSADTVVQDRTYYGVTRVLEDGDGWHLLLSGTTVHGAQDPDRPDVPLTYYAPGGPLADTIEATDPGGDRSIGVIGLGAGSIAAYLDGGDDVRFYEIDPAVIDIATDPDTFGFIDRSAGAVDIVEGDGRLAVEAARPATHDLLIVDAFSSDAIPVHLITVEALASYRRALVPEGVVVFHVSNRFFDLVPVVGRLAAEAGLTARARTGIGDVPGSLVSSVVAVGTPEILAALDDRDGWGPAPVDGPLWTDDHADVLSVLHLV